MPHIDQITFDCPLRKTVSFSGYTFKFLRAGFGQRLPIPVPVNLSQAFVNDSIPDHSMFISSHFLRANIMHDD